MVTFPRAKTDGVAVIELSDCFVFQNAEGEELARLDKVAGLVFRLADGKTPVAEIAKAVAATLEISADNETIWAALDQLADAGLIRERLTPPANNNPVSRRGMLHMASLAGGALLATPMVARAQTLPNELPEQFIPGGLIGGNPFEDAGKESAQKHPMPSNASGPTSGNPNNTISIPPSEFGGGGPKPSNNIPVLTYYAGQPGFTQFLQTLKCFISTACVTRAGLPDDCHELEALRALRKRHIQFALDGPEFLAEYAANSPNIIERMDQDPEADQLWQSLLVETKQVVALVDSYRDDEAFEECKRIYRQLREKYELTLAQT
jgi:hypothetical protein